MLPPGTGATVYAMSGLVTPAPPLSWQPLRLAVLALLLGVVQLWVSLHLAGNWLVLLATLTVLTNTTIQVFQAGSAQEDDDVKRRWSRALARWALHGWSLALLTVAVVLLVSMRSSVRISASGAQVPVTVNLRAIGAAAEEAVLRELRDPEGELHLPCATLWGGRSYILDVQGYRRHYFEVHPWRGAKLVLTRDLEVAPTLLVRLTGSLRAQAAGGEIRLSRRTDQGIVLLAKTTTEARRAAARFGRARELPGTLLEGWRIEVEASMNEDAPRGAVARVLDSWLRPLPVGEVLTLRPGDPLRAEFLAPDGTLQAQLDFSVGSGHFQDIRLLPD